MALDKEARMKALERRGGVPETENASAPAGEFDLSQVNWQDITSAVTQVLKTLSEREDVPDDVKKTLAKVAAELEAIKTGEVGMEGEALPTAPVPVNEKEK